MKAERPIVKAGNMMWKLTVKGELDAGQQHSASGARSMIHGIRDR